MTPNLYVGNGLATGIPLQKNGFFAINIGQVATVEKQKFHWAASSNGRSETNIQGFHVKIFNQGPWCYWKKSLS